MPIIAPFNANTITANALKASVVKHKPVGFFLGSPTVVAFQIFFQRIYGVTVNISDEGLESLDVLTTVNL